MSSPTLTWEQYQQLPPEQRQRPLTPAEYAALTMQQKQAAGLEDAQEGAPTDFNGPVFPNPNHIQPQEDTASGVSDTRLPNGVAFNRDNYQDGAQMDSSNPATAQIIPAAAQTTGAPIKPSGNTVPMVFADDPSGGARDVPYEQMKEAQAQGGKMGVYVKFKDDPSGKARVVPSDKVGEAVQNGGSVLPYEEQDVKHAGFWQNLSNDLQAMIPKPKLGALGEEVPAGRVAAGEHQRVLENAQAAAEDAQRRAAGYGLPYRTVAPLAQGLGVNVPGMEQSAREGDVAGVAGHAAALPVTMAATEGLVRGIPLAKRLGSAALATEAGQKVAQSAKVLGASAEELPVVGKTVKAAKKLGELRDVWSPDPNVPYAGETEPPTPSPKAEPEAASRSQVETSEPEVKTDTSPKAVEQKLNEALGGQPLKPGVPLKNQATAAAPKASALPEGFTPTESSALKGYKYSPDAKELEVVSQNGQHYVYGDMTPDRIAALEGAKSKGAAWNVLKQDSPLVAKVINGKRVAVKPTAAASAAPAAEDLTGQLQQSVDVAKKGGVFTTADPTELTKRWGVDPQSLASGREQTRGMSAADTEADVAKLEARYRKGEPVEPVMETRDADNNLIDVDGRARAIAAQRAGVKRIPIIVRRLPK